MSRAIKVSDRFFRLVSYGSQVFDVSKKDFADKLLDSHLSLIRSRFVEKLRKLPISLERTPKLPISESLISEGLELIKSLDLEKAKELELRLKELRTKKLNGIS